MAVGVIAVVGYLETLRFGFVWDDHRQILANASIQDFSRLPRALVEDVWAFKGERAEAWSNYWRPVFVGWLGLIWSLFGDWAPGWHAASVALHAVASVLVARLALRLGLRPGAALFVGTVFAVHPVHTESVAWVSGATDVLMAVGLLWMLIHELAYARSGRFADRAMGMVGAAFALLAKEASAGLPLLALACHVGRGAQGGRRPAGAVASYGVLVAVFLWCRYLVLGFHAQEVPWQMTPAELAASVPRVAFFYARQLVAPMTLSPTYPVRAAEPTVAQWLIVGAMLAVAAALTWAASRLLRGAPDRLALGAGLLVVPLLPALKLDAFVPDQLVHDRYLYVSVAGLAILAGALWDRLLGERPMPRAVACLAAVFVVAPLVVAQQGYLPAWRDDVALWQRGIRVDPGSASGWSELAAARLQIGDLDGAASAADFALSLEPVTVATIVRAEVDAAQGRQAQAERGLRRVLETFPGHVGAIERLAQILAAGGRFTEAEGLLAEAGELAPYRRCSLDGNRAVVLALGGRVPEAIDLLEQVIDLPADGSTACSLAPFRLGLLELERGDGPRARRSLEVFLERSGGNTGLRSQVGEARRLLSSSDALVEEGRDRPLP